MNYPLGDFLIRFKNSARANKKRFTVRNTKLIESVAKTLKEMGFLDDVKKEDGSLIVSLAYKNKRPVLIDLKIVSKPGVRTYVSVEDLSKRRKPSTLVLSTPKGIMSLKKALKENVGGEVIVEII